MENKLTVNDFFCGAGGMGLGFLQAGYEIKGAWDFDKYAVQSYKANVGTHVTQVDIRKMVYTDIPRAGVWSFGFPCQDLSVAGKVVGLFEGKRSGLFFEVMRLLEETGKNTPGNLPPVIVAENVKGLKPYLDVLHSEYEKAGYKMYYQLFNSRYWGVPQNRERYYVVGIRKDITAAFEYPIEITTNVTDLSTVLEDQVSSNYFLPKNKVLDILSKFAPTAEVCGCPLKYLKRNQKRLYPWAQTVDTMQTTGLYIRGDVRMFTPTEYGRLQAFPMDTWQTVVSDAQAYKQFGNAVTVTVAKAVAESIKRVLL